MNEQLANNPTQIENDIPEGGVLFIVATPIGNLGDITYRAVDILHRSDVVISEDTRKTGILLSHYNVKASRKSYRVHKIEEDTTHAIRLLEQGNKVSFCTDAGTPGISDPGSHLIRGVREKLPDLPIIPIPGPSAMATLLSVCGWQANPSVFLGFLSPKPGKRKKGLENYSDFEGLIVIYESVHRIKRLLNEIREIFPDREILVGRELTKKFEQLKVLHCSVDENAWEISLGEIPEKGEFSLVIGPPAR